MNFFESEISLFDWAEGEPSNRGEEKFLVASSSDMRWADQPSGHSAQVICQKATNIGKSISSRTFVDFSLKQG